MESGDLLEHSAAIRPADLDFSLRKTLLMLTLDNNTLTVRFPEIHPDAVCTIEFQRTLRIPDDNRTHSLPPGLGRFPLAHVDDHTSRLPEAWQKRGGIFLPMHETEAMWLRFSSSYPFAVKIAAGKVNAVTGESWSTELHGSKGSAVSRAIGADIDDQQDYLSIPRQPWLDGFCVGKGKIRQFVAMPLGDGYTVEEQLTGEALHGGLQIIVYPLKPEFYVRPRSRVVASSAGMSFAATSLGAVKSPMRSLNMNMGMAPGGLMEQVIHEDSWGIDKFDQSISAKCFVHLLNSRQYETVTGKKPPHAAPAAADYTKNGLPWFAVNDTGAKALPGAPALQKLDSVANLGNKLGQNPLPDNTPLPFAPKVVMVSHGNKVREGDF